MTAFSGVRSSWLMLARNSDFALLAASARSLASRSSSAASTSAGISRPVPRYPTKAPVAPNTGLPLMLR
jgi:hypothetical protein